MIQKTLNPPTPNKISPILSFLFYGERFFNLFLFLIYLAHTNYWFIFTVHWKHLDLWDKIISIFIRCHFHLDALSNCCMTKWLKWKVLLSSWTSGFLHSRPGPDRFTSDPNQWTGQNQMTDKTEPSLLQKPDGDKKVNLFSHLIHLMNSTYFHHNNSRSSHDC